MNRQDAKEIDLILFLGALGVLAVQIFLLANSLL
jgi:hypothetical protein